jgi:Zn-dependent protease
MSTSPGSNRPATGTTTAVSEQEPDRRLQEEPLFARREDDEEQPLWEYERQYEPIHPEPTWRAVLRKLFAPIAFIGALLWKFAGVIGVLFKLKILTVAGSMLVSIGAYALIWGWRFAVGFVVLIFVHEMGHVLAARQQGLKVSAPMFIPFLGAYISMKQLPQNAWKEAQVALAGPLLGTLGSFVCWGIGSAYDSELFTALAFVGFFLNLFNLMPIVPLDGGRAVGALHPAFWVIGLVGLAAMAYFYPNPIILLILVIGGFEIWGRWRNRHHPDLQRYYRVRPWQRIVVGVVYLGLAAVLVFSMGQTHIEKDFGDV